MAIPAWFGGFGTPHEPISQNKCGQPRVSCQARYSLPHYPHMLRHLCGFKLANDDVDTRTIQAYLGRKNIQHIVRYTDLALTRFKNFWRGLSTVTNLPRSCATM
jgi:hypothetical protein